MRRILALFLTASPASAWAVSKASLQVAPAMVPLVVPAAPIPLAAVFPLPETAMATPAPPPSIQPAPALLVSEPIIPATLAAPTELNAGERLLARSAAKTMASFRKQAAAMTESAAADLGSGHAANLRFFDDGNPYRSPEPVVMRAADARDRRLRNAWLRQQENEASSAFVRFLAATVITAIPAAALTPVIEGWHAAPPPMSFVWLVSLMLSAAVFSAALASSVSMAVNLLAFASLRAVRSLRVAHRRALAGKN